MSSIRVLKNFLAISRHKSVAAAAREIGLTAAAAGQQLQQLEADIGVELFDRTKRSMTLNHHGRSLVEPIQEPTFFNIIGKSFGPTTIIATATINSISNQPICGI